MWDYDSLYNKAKYFVRKGLDHETPESAEIPLWCILSLELLARATLSRINPVLLADPREGSNILYALGFPGKKGPTSIPAKTVFIRCMTVCENFSEQEFDRCMEWLNWRNEDLHTGNMPFENLRTGRWLPDFFRICSILLEHNETDLEDFVGTSHTSQANEMLESLSREERKRAHKAVKEAREKFQQLEVSERLEKLKDGDAKLEKLLLRHKNCKRIKCPSCEGSACLVGDLIRSTTPKEEEGELTQDDVWLPKGIGCLCCTLKISGHAGVAVLEFGDQFVTKDYLDPKDYFEIEFDPADYFEPDYGND